MPNPTIPEFRIEGDLGPFQSSLSWAELKAGLGLLTLQLSAARPARPSHLKLCWSQAALDVQASWNPAALRDKGLPADWAKGFPSSLSLNAPILCLHNAQGLNRLCFAASELLRPLEIAAGFREESKAIVCSLGLFGGEAQEFSSYQIQVRIDQRGLAFSDCLAQAAAWWESLPGAAPCPVPEAAGLPALSTWYSFHQNLDPQALEAECSLAKELGCATLILDDGWQTSDSKRGYAFCGDWEADPQRFPDMQSHVARVHALGLKFMLWVALPLIGRSSKAFKIFEGKLLGFDESLQAGILDPRFPEAREYLASRLEKNLRDWGLDGYKLDFIDQFGLKAPGAPASLKGHDCGSVDEGLERLILELSSRLRRIQPGLLIEFRQAYNGPKMRAHGNMFRAADCPFDAIGNRIRTLDLRLLSGKSAVHSDMLAWPAEASPEVAALQLLNVLFAVPQISVRLQGLPEGQRRMLEFWLGFWRQQQGLLLDGKLEPLHPELNYPQVHASNPGQRLVAAYGADSIDLRGKTEPEIFLVNARLETRVLLQMEGGPWAAAIFDCQGRPSGKKFKIEGAACLPLEIPACGLLALKKDTH